MKTLYLRIVITTMLIMVLSALLSFFLSNVWYHFLLKEDNDHKNTDIAQKIVNNYDKQKSKTDIDDYLNQVADLGYQLYRVSENGDTTSYGAPFRNNRLDASIVQSVLQGKVYHGMAQYPIQPFVTGFFDNELTNSIGVPVRINGKKHALFLRPDVKKQFGEMRVFLAVLLIMTLCLSFLFVFITTRFIVKPITELTEATKKIAEGEYNLSLNVSRKDEIGNLARHFSWMSQHLARLEEMRQEFVSNVSHEIQSPLASIQGYSQTLRTDDIPEDKRKEYLSIIEKESRRMSSLSKQLLTLAFLEKESVSLEKTKFDLASQIKHAVMVTEWHWREKDLAIELSLPSIHITGDPKLLFQVWTNLINNAIKFTDPGGTIDLSIDSSDKKDIIVQVKDTGAGISEQELTHIFDRFHKGDRSRKREIEGSGLGLAITKKVVELHNGSITVSSRPGRGTTFRIALPEE